MCFPDGSRGKKSTRSAEDAGLIPGSGRSCGKGNGNPLQYSCLKKSHGQRKLPGYNPKGYKELDTPEHAHTRTHTHTHTHTHIHVRKCKVFA